MTFPRPSRQGTDRWGTEHARNTHTRRGRGIFSAPLRRNLNVGSERLFLAVALATPKNKRANFQPVIASSAPASGRSPWMKRAIRSSVHSGRISRDERLHCFSFSVRKLPLCCFATSLLAMTIQLDRRPLAAGANGGGIKAPSKTFSKLLQNSRVSLQASPNKALAVLWDFKGYKVSKRPLMLSKFFASSRPLLAAFCSGFTMKFCRRRFHRGAATQIERILNLTDNPVFGKKYP